MMMILNVFLVLLAVSFVPSLVVAQAGDEVFAPKMSAAAAATPPMLRGASVEAPTEQKQQQQHQEEEPRDLQDTLLCYEPVGDGKLRHASCSSVGICDSYACCTSMASCYGQGQHWCGGSDSYASGLAIEYANEASCPYRWSCCY
jgi:hypothetical protein